MYHYIMANLFILYITLTVFGVGATVADFLGVMDHHSGDSDGAGGHDGHNGHDLSDHHGSNLSPENKQSDEKRGFQVVVKIISFLRNMVYFSLGFGPTGLFASLSGLPKISGLLWACGVGAAMIILARTLKRFIRRDLDSSIKPDDLLKEKGILLLPLEGKAISKAAVRQFGREMEIYVRCKNMEIKLPKGKEIIVVDYDNDVYWIEPLE
jgi:hypothetical protein